MGALTRASGTTGNYRGTFTWANKPAVGYLGQSIIVSDLGLNGVNFVWTGAKWSRDCNFIFQQSTLNYIVPSLTAPTYSQLGNVITVTNVGHNISAIENGGSIYLLQGTVLTGVAPTSNGQWFTNFTWLTADTFSCQATNSQTATGLFLQNLSETTIPVTKVLPGGVLGATGILETDYTTSCNNSANTKIAYLRLGGAAYHYVGVGINSVGIRAHGVLSNISETKQTALKLGFAFGFQAGAASDSWVSLALNTTLPLNNSISVAVGSANDYMAVSNFISRVNPT